MGDENALLVGRRAGSEMLDEKLTRTFTNSNCMLGKVVEVDELQDPTSVTSSVLSDSNVSPSGTDRPRDSPSRLSVISSHGSVDSPGM